MKLFYYEGKNNLNKVKVSVCVVTHNNENEILNLVDSIFNNTKDVSFSVYLVDNNSTDNTVKVVSDKYKQVKIIKNPDNKGFGYAHNKVLKHINSDYHIIINPDIYFNEDVISYLCNYFDKQKNVSIVTPKVLFEDGTEQYLPKRDPKIRYLFAGKFEKFSNYFKKLRNEYTMKDKSIKSPTNIEFCTGCFMMIKTSLFKKLNGFDDRFFMYFEDADLSRRARNFGNIIFNPDVTVTHLWHRASSKSIKFLIIHISSLIKYLKKWNFRSF